MLYLGAYLLVWAVAFAGEQKSRIVKNVGYGIAVFLLAMFAGLRDASVGIDVHTYVTPMFDIAQISDSIVDYYSLLAADLSTKDLEPLFTLVGYFGSLSGSVQVLLFIYELMVLAPTLVALLLFEKAIGDPLDGHFVSLGLLCFCLLFYNFSLMIIRQFIACALLFLAFGLAVNDDNLQAIIACATAALIHITSIVASLYLFAILLLVRKGNRRALHLLLIGTGLICLMSPLLLPFAMGLAGYAGVSIRYLSTDYMLSVGGDANIAWLYLILVLAAETMPVLFVRNEGLPIAIEFIFHTPIVALCLYPLSVVSANAGRILYYFFFFAPAVMPCWYINFHRFVRDKHLEIVGHVIKPQIFNYLIPILVSLVYWVGSVALHDYTGTLNYILFF